MNKIIALSVLSITTATLTMTPPVVSKKVQEAKQAIKQGQTAQAQTIIKELRAAKQNRFADSLELLLRAAPVMTDKAKDEAIKRSEIIQANMNNRINQLLSALENGTLERVQLATELANYKKEQQELLKDIIAITQLLNQVIEKDIQKNDELARLQQELDTIESAYKEKFDNEIAIPMEKKIASLEQEIVGYTEKIKQLEAKNLEIADLQKKLKDATEQLIKENETIARLQAELDDAKTQLKVAQEKGGTGNAKELYEANEKIKTLVRDNAELKNKNDTLSNDLQKTNELLAAATNR